MASFRARRFLSLVLLSCGITTVIIVLVFPRGFIALIQTMQLESAGGWGQITHLRELATAQDREVAKPNRDTIYSSVVIDLARGPVVIAVPPYAHYWNVQFIDASSNVFAYMGSRLGNEDSDRTALLVSPAYRQQAGELRIIRATSDKVWLVYRFHVIDEHNIAAAVAVQNSLEVIPLRALRGE
jgi:hypothetical protein